MQNPEKQPARPIDLIGLAITGVFACVFMGGISNIVNGLVSPTYFVNIMRWHDVDNVWRAAIDQGMLEGLVCGILLSLIFTSVVGFVSKATCPYSVGVRYILGILGAALVCWVAGGLFAMGLAMLSPKFYRTAFISVPQDTGEMLKYAWVGGSITGLQLGGFACVLLASFVFRAKWHRRT